MKLTDDEQQELAHLRYCQQDNYRFMSQQEQDRLHHLLSKEWHNQCVNPQCVGGEYQEYETHCPLCRGKIDKSLTKPRPQKI